MTTKSTEVAVPVSVGELVDKITILRIKHRNIKAAEKLRNIAAELNALVAVAQGAGIDLNDPVVAELESVNQKLWDIEDEIRDKERAREFDARFIELARAVYVTNDQRFRLKALVNEKSGSAFREEKSYKEY